jgi:RHS repeat-associated protein
MPFDPTTKTLRAIIYAATTEPLCKCWEEVVVQLNNVGTPQLPAWQGTSGVCNGTITLKYYLSLGQGYLVDYDIEPCGYKGTVSTAQGPKDVCYIAIFGAPPSCCKPGALNGVSLAAGIIDPSNPCPVPPAVCPWCDAADSTSDGPVRYATGELVLSATDLQSKGYGIPWGHTRTYSNQFPSPVNMGNGWNWQVRDWPYAVLGLNGLVTIMGEMQNVLWFDLVSGSYVPRFNVRDSLQLDSANQIYVWTKRDGTVTKFSSVNGGFISQTTPAGNSLAIYSRNSAEVNPTEVRRTTTVGATTTIESLLYTYDNPDAALPNLTNILLRRSTDAGNTWINVSQVTYTYYAQDDAFGFASDLQTVTTANWTGSAWANTGTTLYRYYTPNSPSSSSSSSSGGGSSFSSVQAPNHLLKFVVLPASYNQLAAVANPLTASDATVSMYADYFYVYDSNNRVVSETVKQGSQNYAFSAVTSGNTQGYNSWATKTVETLPDGNQNIVYANYAGQTMLKVFQQPGSSSSSSSGSSSSPSVNQWCTYYKYDSNANLILQANPSAVLGFDETKADLVNWQGNTAQYLKNNAGLINTFTYDPVSLEKSGELVQQGQLGAPIIVRQYQYTSCCNPAASSNSSSSAGSSSSSSGSSSAPFTQPCVYFLSKLIEYPDDGSGASSSSSSSSGASGTANGNTRQIVTTYSYTFWRGTCAVQQKTTTWPVIPTSQNGSGVAAQKLEYFDTYGNLLWSMDERGFITGFTYDIPTGALSRRIDDVDTTQVAAPAGWLTPSGGGLHLITDYQFDAQGRTTQVLGPVHTIDIGGVATSIRRAEWTVYQDAIFQAWQGQGYQKASDGSYMLINPVSISIADAQGRVTDEIKAVRYAAGTSSSSSSSSISASAPVLSPGRLTALDNFPQSSYVRWTTTQYSDCCFVASRRAYKLIPAIGTGFSGTNYDETDFGYDLMKRQNRVVAPGGTITRMVFDAVGRRIGTWMGTNDTGATATNPAGSGSPNNMVQITGLVYDNGLVGDSNVTRQTDFVDTTGLNDRVTSILYDFRNRRTDTDGEIDFYAKQYFDNLDRVYKKERYNTTLSGNLIGRSIANFDDRHRVFQTIRYAVDASTGVLGNSLTDNTWFDASGNSIKSLPAGSQLAKKTVIDSLGRSVTQYVGYNYSDTTYATAGSVAGDIILEQTDTTYDAASNVIQTNARQRYHNATGTGSLGSPSSAQPLARVTYVAVYPDALGRTIGSADFGTNGGIALSRPSTVPARSDTCLVISATFNARGEACLSTDPVGTQTFEVFDDCGRRISLTDNYIASASSSNSSSSSSGTCAPGDDQNRTTIFTYSPDNLPATIIAVNATTGNQTTTYTYGTTLSDSAIASSQLKRYVTYPDSVNGSDQVAFTYNRQSQVTTKTDQNGTVHSYDFDKLARQTADRITTLGTGVDNAVLRISTNYEVRGLVQNITSYDNATVGQGNIVNDVQRVYNAFAQLATEYQSHSGAVNMSSTPKVQYNYANGSANAVRPTSLTYPNGRILNYNYGTMNGTNDAASRIASLLDNDGITTLADYTYVGTRTFIEVNEPQPAIKYTLIGIQSGNDPVTGDIYRGLDLFNRVTDLIWVPSGTSSSSRSSSSGPGTNLVRIQQSYDRAGNQLSRQNLVAKSYGTGFDELYGYDGLYRLTTAARGTLDSSQTNILAGTATFSQCWTLDSVGNWKAFREDDTGNGNWSLVQSRSANLVNEIATIANSTGPAWTNPAYDNAGNMITIPQPAAPTAGYTATYDAWNRLVKLVALPSSQIVQTNGYDGRNYRAVRNGFTAGVLSETRHYFYTSAWQLIEERVGTSPSPNRQFVWGGRFVDDLVLRDRDALGAGTLTERLYPLQDLLGSVNAVVSSTGVVQERYAYSPYGALTVLSPAFTANAGSSFDWETQFVAYRLDSGLGLHLVRNRYYNCRTGTWLSREPYARGGNRVMRLYLYAAARPTNLIDPSGLDDEPTPPIVDVIPNKKCWIEPDAKDNDPRLGVSKRFPPLIKRAFPGKENDAAFYKSILDKTVLLNCFAVPGGGAQCHYIFANRFKCKCDEQIIQHVTLDDVCYANDAMGKATKKVRCPDSANSEIWEAHDVDTRCDVHLGGTYVQGSVTRRCVQSTLTACCGRIDAKIQPNGRIFPNPAAVKAKCSGPERKYTITLCVNADGSGSLVTSGLIDDSGKSADINEVFSATD